MAFFESVKPQRCTTGPVEPLNGINKDVCGAKLQPTTVLAYPVDCDCLYHLLVTHHCCMCPNGSLNPPSASHLPPPPPASLPPTLPLIHAIGDITVTVKKLLKIQQC